MELSGSARRKTESMSRFQNQRNDRVLLLSLEKAASGANLTSANHILFVHPMCAASTTKVKKYSIIRNKRVDPKVKE